jgi:hypothetical protein
MFKTKLPKKLYPSTKRQLFIQIDKLYDIMYEREKLLTIAREVCLILEPIMLFTYTSKTIVHELNNIPYNTIQVKNKLNFNRNMVADFDGDIISYNYSFESHQIYPSIARMAKHQKYEITKVRKNKIVFELPSNDLSKIYNMRYAQIPLAGSNILDKFKIPLVKNIINI